MIKKILIILFLLFLFIVSLVTLISLPFVTYWAIINQKYDFKFYKMEDPERMAKLLVPGRKLELDTKEDNSFDQRFWKTFHIENYKMPLPIFHPLYVAAPVINEKDYHEYVELGVRFLNQSQKMLGEVIFNESKKFNKYLQAQPIFTLPIVKTFLESKEADTIWKDLYLRDLGQNEFKQILTTPLEDMVYNLYILHLRMKYFPNNLVSYFFHEKFQLGGIETTWENKDLKKEALIFMVDGVLESYSLVSRFEDQSAKSLREVLVNSINYFPSMVDQSRILYEQFRDLPYNSKTSPEGMLYLFAAWTHNTQDKEFMREIIGYLERGEGNFAQLHALYAFAIKHYGKDFSGNRKQSKNLDEKIQEEERLEIKQEEKNKISEDKGEGEGFDSKENKMKYFLQKAKEKKKNEENSKVLIFD